MAPESTAALFSFLVLAVRFNVVPPSDTTLCDRSVKLESVLSALASDFRSLLLLLLFAPKLLVASYSLSSSVSLLSRILRFSLPLRLRMLLVFFFDLLASAAVLPRV